MGFLLSFSQATADTNSDFFSFFMDTIGDMASLFYFLNLFFFQLRNDSKNYIKNRLCGNWGQNEQRQYIPNETSLNHPATNWAFHSHFAPDVSESTAPPKAA